ncbi:hypothetical protein HO173_004251 [Letharia columbiana]|uniref:Uncharacterized protein n=1 Tax=Letharia columbiana TaxID=112416 RepID=A0A8H6L6I5_9LECA|nr:uncharacterized protein HO173_004251 [Letharia columbiana]KAF6237361.1 hypothetical protein HO173_004251 [Letharia columbiana]
MKASRASDHEKPDPRRWEFRRQLTFVPELFNSDFDSTTHSLQTSIISRTRIKYLSLGQNFEQQGLRDPIEAVLRISLSDVYEMRHCVSHIEREGPRLPNGAKIQSVQAQHDATEKKDDAGTEFNDLPKTENVMLPF